MKHSTHTRSFANSPRGKVRRIERKQAIQRKRSWFATAALPALALAIALPFMPSPSLAQSQMVDTGKPVVFMILANKNDRTQEIIYMSDEISYNQCDKLQRSIWGAPYPVAYTDDIGAWPRIDASCTPLSVINGESE